MSEKGVSGTVNEPEAEAPPANARLVAGPENRPARVQGVTLRAFLIGMGMIVLLVVMSQAMSIRTSAADVAGGAPPPAPTYFLFFYVLVVAPLLAKLSHRLALSRGELLLIYSLMLIVGPLLGTIGLAFLLPSSASPTYYSNIEPTWSTFRAVLPEWLGPRDPIAVREFYRGAKGPIPWHAWTVPILAWASLLTALFFTTLCLNVLMRKQYVEHERLTFPLTAIPLVLTEEGKPIFGKALFWIGIAIPLLVQGPIMLNRYVPSIPAIQLREVLLINAGEELPPPWSGLGEIYFSLIFWLIGIVYLVPKEIGFSGWFFYLLCLAQNVAAVAYGRSEGPPSVYSNDFPALYAQGAGAAFALTGITLYAARHHLRAVKRKVFERAPDVDDSREFLSYRTAFWGTVIGVVFMLSWMVAAGMRPWIAALLLALLLAYFFIFARVRAETGLGMGVVLWPKMLDEMMLTLVGAKYMTLSDLTVLFSLRWLYFTPSIGSVAATQLEGIKLCDTGGLRGRGVGWALAFGATVTVLLALYATLKTFYDAGFELLPMGRRTVMVGAQSYFAYVNLLAAHSAPKGPDLSGIFAIGVGAFVTVALYWMRLNFLGFPLHPVGYLAANSWGMHLHWVTFLIGWLIKAAVMRYGGLGLYRHLLPLFLGMIIGDMIHQGVWGVIGWATGGAQ